MAADDPTNATSSSQSKPADLAALAARLAAHAEGIENIAAQAMADDMTAAARAIDKLVAGIRRAAADTTDATTRRELTELIGGA